MFLTHITLKNHPILKNIDINLINKKTGKPYAVVAFVGENGCGKTTLLNEIFNYEKSEYVVKKQSSLVDGKSFSALYLRQGSLHRNAMKEVRKLIDGKDMYPVNSSVNRNNTNSPIVSPNSKSSQILEKLGDNEITFVYEGNHIGEVYCSNDVSKLIDGKDHGYNITKYSSGQQEILLKLKDLTTITTTTDCVLLDEPETSLHPRWQKEIVAIIESMLDAGEIVPQIFLATHSEKVLESLILRNDVLIVRLFKENDTIETETISQMDLCLPSPTFAELDYVVFHIPSLDYHDQLLTRFADMYELDNIWAIDKAIREQEEYNSKEYKKLWVAVTKKGITSYKTLPVYIRNYFHHPKNDAAPTEEELVKSILFLRSLVNTIKD